jgi:hypothetical protein
MMTFTDHTQTCSPPLNHLKVLYPFQNTSDYTLKVYMFHPHQRCISSTRTSTTRTTNQPTQCITQVQGQHTLLALYSGLGISLHSFKDLSSYARERQLEMTFVVTGDLRVTDKPTEWVVYVSPSSLLFLHYYLHPTDLLFYRINQCITCRHCRVS